MRKMILIFVIVGLVVGLTAGCTQEAAVDTSTIVISQGVDATTLDPHMHAETTTTNITIQIFDRLFMRDSDMKLQPHLAESITLLEDGSWELKLKEDIFFHNGEPFNAESVLFSIERILDPQQGSPQIANLNMIEKVDIIDDTTLRIWTKTPYPLMAERLSLEMVPPKYIQENGREYFAEHPVGTGPYRFVRWVKDEEIVLEANNEYWQGAPAIQEVLFRPIPENAVRLAALQTGDVDLAVNVPPHQVETVEQAQGCRIESVPSGRFIFLQLVANQGGLMGDKKVRQALNYAVDVPSVIEHVLGGRGIPSTQPLTPYDFGYNPDVEGYRYDPQKARELLAEAGYPEGIEITLDVPSGRYAMDKEVAEALVGQMAEAGIDATLQINEWGVHITKLLDKQMEHAFLIGWGTSLFDADATLFPQLHSQQRLTYFGDEQLDRLLEQARSCMDAAERESLYHQAVERVVEEAPFVFLYQQEDIYGVSDRLVWEPRADELILVDSMALK